jgi:hypothetical protein
LFGKGRLGVFWQHGKNLPSARKDTCVSRLGIDVSPVHVPRWEGEREIKNIEGFLMQMYKRERVVWQVKNNQLLEIRSFFTWQTFLGIGKSQDLPSSK